MLPWDKLIIKAGARPSPLSLVQTREVQAALQKHYPNVIIDVVEFTTEGDADQKTSLRTLDKTDFFTQTIDRALLKGECRIGIHSAKDLPAFIPEGLTIAAITVGLDNRDALVIREGIHLKDLPPGAIIATSSERREEAVKALLPDATFVDVRGTIHQRLALLNKTDMEGVVIAEAALIRLQLTHLNRVYLPGPTTPLQGQLAVLCRKDDEEMLSLFSSLDTRPTHLHTGLRAPSIQEHSVKHVHAPFIKTVPIPSDDCTLIQALNTFDNYTHVIFTSQTAVNTLMGLLKGPDPLKNKTLIAVGKSTHSLLMSYNLNSLTPPVETAEGVCTLLSSLPLKDSYVFWPRSAQARPLISDFLKKSNITHLICDLYQTLPIRPNLPFSLSSIHSVSFYSPSCVDSFLACFYPPPQNIHYSFIGPITESKWRSYGLQNSL